MLIKKVATQCFTINIFTTSKQFDEILNRLLQNLKIDTQTNI